MSLADVTLTFVGELGGNIVADLSKVKAQLDQFTNGPPTKVKIDLDDSAFQAKLKAARAQLTQLSGGSASGGSKILKATGAGSSNVAQQMKKEYQQIKQQNTQMNSLAKQVEATYSKLLANPLSNKNRQNQAIGYINTLRDQMKNFPNANKALVANMEAQLGNINRIVAGYRQAENAAKQSVSSLGSRLEKIDTKFGKVDVSKLSTTSVEAYEAALRRARTAMEALRSTDLSDSSYAGKYDAAKSAIDALSKSYDAATKEVKEFNNAQRMTEREAKAMTRQMTSMQGQIQKMFEKNKRLDGTIYGNQLNNIYDSIQGKIESGAKISSSEIADYRAQIDAITASAKNAGKIGATLGDTIVGAFKKFGGWMLVTHSMTQVMDTIRQLIQNVRELDAAMTELKKVTDLSDRGYEEFFERAKTRAKETGATLTDTINASADFSRLGYNISDAEKLADVAIVYKNVGDGIEDISEASQSVISTMKAFGIEAQDAYSVVDKFNAVGNSFAISSKGVGDALTRSASALAAGGNTLDESIALVTAGNEVVQDPEKMGTVMKTLSMYLRSAKTEAEDAGIETTGMADSVSKLRDELLSLTGGRVDIQIDDDTFKSTYQIMKELSQVWDDLTDITRANILEKIGGKRNANVTAAILQNFATAERVVETAANSSGSALAENEKYLDSINGKIAQFQASWQSLSATMISSDMFKGVVDGATTFVNIIDAIASKVGAIPTLIGGITAGISAFRLANGDRTGIFDVMTDPQNGNRWTGVKIFNTELKNVRDTIKDTYKTLRDNGGTIFGSAARSGGWSLFGAVTGVSSDIKVYEELARSYRDAHEEYKKMEATKKASGTTFNENDESALRASRNWERAQESMESYHQVVRNGKGLWNEYARAQLDAGKNIEDLSSKGFRAWVKQEGKIKEMIGSSLRNFGANALSMIGSTAMSAGISFLVSAAISGITKLITYQERLRQEAAETANTYNETQKSIASYTSEVAQIKTGLESGTMSIEETISARERLMAIQNELVSAYGSEAEGLNLISLSADEAAVAMERLSAAEADRYLNDPENKKGFKQAQEKMEKVETGSIYGIGFGENGTSNKNLVKQVRDLWGEYDAFSVDDLGADNFTLHITADARDAIEQIDSFISEAESRGIDLGKIETSDFGNLKQALLAERNLRAEINAAYGDQYDAQADSQIKTTESFLGIQKEIAAARAEYDKAITGSYDSDETRASAISDSIQKIHDVQTKFNNMDFTGFKNVQETLEKQLDAAVSGIGSEEFKADLELNVKTDKLDEAMSLYKNDLQEATAKGADYNKTLYGNIDLQNRQRLEWDKTTESNKKNLESWGRNVQDYLGSFSTVDASSMNFDGVEIAFTPMLQTDHGAEYLDKGTVMNYIGGLIDAASQGDGKWTADEIFKLDAAGMEVNGKRVQGLIADIGDTAQQTAETMHYIGKDGSTQDYINNIKDSFDSLYENAPEKMKHVLDAVKQFQTETGEIKLSDILDSEVTNPAAWEAVTAAAKDYGVTVETLLQSLANMNIIQSDTNALAFDAATRFSELKTSTEAIETQQSTLSTALSEQAANGTISLGTYNSLIATSKDFANTLEYEAGAMKINGEAAQKLVEAKTKEQVAEMQLAKSQALDRYEQNKKAIESLIKKQVDLDEAQQANLTRWQSENKSIMDTVNKYNILIAQLQRATGAYSQWQNAKQTENSDSIYKNLVTAKKDIDEALKSGQTGKGNDDYTMAIKLLVPDGEDVKAYRDNVLNRYLKLDDSGGLKWEGLGNFLNDAVSKGLMQVESDGAYKVAAKKVLQDFIDEMKITPEVAKSIFDALEMYDFEFDFSDEEFLDAQNVDLAKQRVQEYNDELNKLQSEYEEIQNNKDLTPEARTEQLDAVLQKIDDANAKEIIAEVQVDAPTLTDAEAALAGIYQKQEELENAKTTIGVDSDEAKQAQQDLEALQSYIDNLDDTTIEITVADINAKINESLKTMGDYKVGSAPFEAAKADLQSYLNMLNQLPDEVKTKYGIDAEYEAKLQQILDGKVSAKDITVKVKADTTEIEQAKETVANAINTAMTVMKSGSLGSQTFDIDGNTDAAKAKIKALESQVVKIKIDGDPGPAKEKIASIQATTPVTVTVTADPSTAQAQINSLQANPVMVNVSANTAIAQMEIAALSARLNATSHTVTVDYQPNTSSLPTRFSSLTRTVNYVANTRGLPSSLSSITRTVYYKSVGDGFSGKGGHFANGTAHANGIANQSGGAMAGGNWGAKTGGMTLVGELGRKHFATLHSNVQSKYYLIAGTPLELYEPQRGYETRASAMV